MREDGGFVLKAKSLKKGEEITPPQGKLGVLIPGIAGVVSTTFIAGVQPIRRGLAEPVVGLPSSARSGWESDSNTGPLK